MVLAVIALLAGLSLPALSKAKYSAKNAACQNNLRQISLGVALYTSTHGAFPPFAFEAAGVHYGNWWMLLELPTNHTKTEWLDQPAYYAESLAGVFRCPFNRGSIVTMHFGPDSGRTDGSTEQVLMPSWTAYGYNAWAIEGGPSPLFPEGLGLGGGSAMTPGVSPWVTSRPTLESAMRAPSEMIALGDEFVRSRNAALDALMSRDTTIAPATHYAGVDIYDSKTPPKKQPAFIAHHGRANRAFVDGHLESEDLRKPFTASESQLKRWNLDHEAHRNWLAD